MLQRLTLVFLLILGLHSCEPSHSEQPATRATIDSLMTQVTKAAAALDADRFMAFFARDSALLIVFNGQALTGWDTLANTQRKYWATLSSAAYNVRETRITVFGPDVAVATNFGTIQEVPRVGEPRQGAYISTVVWHRRPEGWRVVHAHESTSP